MKRAKRDMTERAYRLGYNQGLKGHTKESCPFHDTEKRGQWMGGWRQGHAYYVAGYRMPSELWAGSATSAGGAQASG